MTELRVENLSVVAGGARLVEDASFGLKAGELVVLIGPNGAGKTSLLRAALGLVTPASGRSSIDGEAFADLSPSARARQISYLPQMRPLAWPSRVRDIVALGRFAHGAALGRLANSDEAAVDEAIRDCGLEAFVDRRADTLSGGELARVHCARAFAAKTPLIIADEPVAALDLKHQFAILDLFKAYVKAGGGALLVLHDLRLAGQYADRLVWMDQGRIIADGSPEETLTPARLRDVFGVEAKVLGGTIETLRPITS